MRKLGLVLLSSVFCVATSFGALAGDVPTSEEIARWESEYCYPNAQYDGKMSRALVLVGSDVQKSYSGFGAYGYIWGYTEVKDGDADAYHYTRVEGRESGVTIAEKTEYGYGYVEAETDDIEEAIHRTIEARVFWGEG